MNRFPEGGMRNLFPTNTKEKEKKMDRNADIRPVLQTVAHALGVQATPEQWLSGVPFDVNGQTFSLQQAPGDGATGMIVLRSELGTVPRDAQLQVCEMLLRSNALSAGSLGPVAGMQLDGPGLVMDMPLPMAELTADMLYGVLDRMAESAAVWKATKGFTQAQGGTAMAPSVAAATATAAR